MIHAAILHNTGFGGFWQLIIVFICSLNCSVVAKTDSKNFTQNRALAMKYSIATVYVAQFKLDYTCVWQLHSSTHF